ncbi:phage portal protein [Ornithinibacillus sp. 4-3]|uniref:Phage portal protein n=1 Tax=Ornithinibacillus sp. 4-3 TaxID=3231488 RepID=A0AB39HSU5_9BACI
MTENHENTFENQEENKVVANDITFFMPGNFEEAEVVESPISKRFKDNEGKIIPFRFKPLSTERVDEIEELNQKTVRQKGKILGRETDFARFIAHVAVETTIYPNFKDEKFRQAYGTQDPIEIAKKVLNVAGEYSNWIAKISEVNGFDDTIDELEEAAKN